MKLYMDGAMKPYFVLTRLANNWDIHQISYAHSYIVPSQRKINKLRRASKKGRRK